MPTANRIPRLTFVVPAYNASATLHLTLDSILAQTQADWQAVVVDDGSTDSTHDIALAYARNDPRIKVLHQANAGVSAARNAGVAAADAAHICLLDSDDWIDRTYMARMLKPLPAEANGFASYCSYRRVLDGRMLAVDWAPDLTGDNARHCFSLHCAVSIFCVVFTKTDYDRVSGMNTTLKTCEDWELWLKMAFGGVQFVEVRRSLCFYNQHTGSLSRDIDRLMQDSAAVARLSDQLNARETVPYAVPGTAAALSTAWWLPQKAITGADCASLIPLIEPLPYLGDHTAHIAGSVAHALYLSMGIEGHKDLQGSFETWHDGIDQLFKAMERSTYPGFARELWLVLLKQLVHWMPPHGMWITNGICAFSVDLDSIPDVTKPDAVDTMVVVFTQKGKIRGSRAGPMFGDFQLPSMEDTIAYLPRVALLRRRRAPLILAKVFVQLARDLVKQRRSLLQLFRTPGARRHKLKSRLTTTIRRILAPVGADSAYPKDSLTAASRHISAMREASVGSHEPVKPDITADRFVGEIKTDTQAFWEDVFESADPWDYFSPYEQTKYRQTLAEVCREPVNNAMEVACAEGIFTRMMASHVDRLRAVDISERALDRARQRCANLTNIDYGVFNLIDDTLPSGLDLIVCSEVLYYVGAHRLGGIAEKYANALNDGGRVIMAHSRTVEDAPHRTGFDWSSTYGMDTIRTAFMTASGLVLERSVETELYVIDTFRKSQVLQTASPEIVEAAFDMPETKVLRSVVWDGVIRRREAALEREAVRRIPVLMYHRIAEDGPEALAPWRVAPSDFEAQLRLLRRHGYYSLSSKDLSRHIRDRSPVPGRPVLISFDDAYQDFADTAFPILDRNDFSADVFVVTGKVGQTSDWDAQYGVAPLMDWPEIERLHGLGIRFGSHMASHRRAPALSSRELLEEAMRSKLELEAQLGDPVTAIAMPYGLFDSRVETILDLCGYTTAFSTESGFVDLYDNPFYLPRLDISGDLTLEAFARMLELNQ